MKSNHTMKWHCKIRLGTKKNNLSLLICITMMKGQLLPRTIQSNSKRPSMMYSTTIIQKGNCTGHNQPKRLYKILKKPSNFQRKSNTQVTSNMLRTLISSSSSNSKWLCSIITNQWKNAWVLISCKPHSKPSLTNIQTSTIKTINLLNSSSNNNNKLMLNHGPRLDLPQDLSLKHCIMNLIMV